jgi:uncharacterized protein YndB with AHSA1/START domain
VISQVLVSVRVKTSPACAFEMFTRDIASWWTPNALFQFTPRSPGTLGFEPYEGGRFTETLANGKVFEIGRIRVWQPGERLVFGWRQATFRPGQETEVDVAFESVGTETRVTVVHRGWDSVPREHVARHGFSDVIFLRRHGEWWQALLARLRDHGSHIASP